MMGLLLVHLSWRNNRFGIELNIHEVLGSGRDCGVAYEEIIIIGLMFFVPMISLVDIGTILIHEDREAHI